LIRGFFREKRHILYFNGTGASLTYHSLEGQTGYISHLNRGVSEKTKTLKTKNDLQGRKTGGKALPALEGVQGCALAQTAPDQKKEGDQKKKKDRSVKSTCEVLTKEIGMWERPLAQNARRRRGY